MVRFLIRLFSAGPDPEARLKPSPPTSEREEILFYLDKFERQLRDFESHGATWAANDMRGRVKWYRRRLSTLDCAA